MSQIQDSMCHDSGIKSLPLDLLVDVLARVASSSSTDLFNSKLCCSDFLGAARDSYVLEKVSIANYPVIHQWLKSEKASLFFNRCAESGNPEAMYRLGMVEYFSTIRLESGLEHLRLAAKKGHIEASYVYGIILLCRGGDSAIEGLKLLNAMKCSKPSGLRIHECRKKIKDVIHTMWINNRIVRHQESLCHHKKINPRVMNTWQGPIEVEDYTRCEACRWDREVNLFCSMLN